mmetsp:Transcript_64553/g.152683  ORF Transcript_64553/g.152683 Transcript_64553/m.152683 type:complete len:102 (-) Transcript_64553:948-1253(-)
MGRYLLPPAVSPEYRAGRDHAEFVTTLRKSHPDDFPLPQTLGNRVIEGLRAEGMKVVDYNFEEAETLADSGDHRRATTFLDPDEILHDIIFKATELPPPSS